ncbi:MAG: cupin domain-containing protein, partial [Paramuribaculum sp.]|nr:cupin domain-containing protein [Paramuribaculum sp.]
ANEENYIILSGSGEFMADNDTFTITQGSVIRVAPACRRNIKCTSSEPLVYICIQALENSLGDYTMTDAVI